MCVHKEYRKDFLLKMIEELSKEKPNYDLLRSFEMQAELFESTDKLKRNPDTLVVEEGKFSLMFRHDIKLPPKDYESILKTFLLTLIQATITRGGLNIMRKYLHEVSRTCINRTVWGEPGTPDP
jgi:hypothetical protein